MSNEKATIPVIIAPNNVIECGNAEGDKIIDDAAWITKHGRPFREFIRFAIIRNSLEAAEFYTRMSQVEIILQNRIFFEYMAARKKLEANEIVRYCQGYQENADASLLPDPSLAGTPTDCNRNGPSENRASDHYNLALKFEWKGYCLYLRLAALEADVIIKKIFLFIAKLHKSNIQIIKDRILSISSLYNERVSLA